MRAVWHFYALKHYCIVKYAISVEIERPLVKIRQVNDHGEQFRPLTTSPFSLLLNEQSQIKHYEGSNFADYLNLLQLPTKPLATFVALADVHRRVSADEGKFIIGQNKTKYGYCDAIIKNKTFWQV